MKPRRPGHFDTFLFADYSGAESESAQKAAISLFRVDGVEGQPRKIVGPFTRATLREALIHQLESATHEHRRVLFGIDHQWSWPRDLLKAATLEDLPWRERLARLTAGTTTLPALSSPSTYAALFNRAVGSDIFHCRVHSLGAKYGLPPSSSWKGNAIRLTETLMPGAKPATRLGGTGAVAGQTLTGLRELHLLFAETKRLGLHVKAWPFELMRDDGESHVGGEIYPAFCKRDLKTRGLLKVETEWTEHDRDAATTALWARQTDLAPLLDLTLASRTTQRIAREEGWILGAIERISGSSPTAKSSDPNTHRGLGRPGFHRRRATVPWERSAFRKPDRSAAGGRRSSDRSPR